MNKAIELISEWIEEQEKCLVTLIERRDLQKHWSEFEEKSWYFLPRYLETKEQVERLERDIAECQQAFIVLNYYFEPTEIAQAEG